MLAHLRTELRTRRDELARQRLVELGDLERGPGAVELDQAIGRNALLLEQPARGGNQRRSLGKGLAPGDRGFPSRLGRAIKALVLLAELARGLLERVFVGQRRQRRELEIDLRRLAGKLQQRLVVGFCRGDPFAPGLQLGFGRGGSGRRARTLRPGRGDLPGPLVEKLVEHASGAAYLIKGSFRRTFSAPLRKV